MPLYSAINCRVLLVLCSGERLLGRPARSGGPASHGFPPPAGPRHVPAHCVRDQKGEGSSGRTGAAPRPSPWRCGRKARLRVSPGVSRHFRPLRPSGGAPLSRGHGDAVAARRWARPRGAGGSGRRGGGAAGPTRSDGAASSQTRSCGMSSTNWRSSWRGTGPSSRRWRWRSRRRTPNSPSSSGATSTATTSTSWPWSSSSVSGALLPSRAAVAAFPAPPSLWFAALPPPGVGSGCGLVGCAGCELQLGSCRTPWSGQRLLAVSNLRSATTPRSLPSGLLSSAMVMWSFGIKSLRKEGRSVLEPEWISYTDTLRAHFVS